jgi:membrane protease YdiL (CAAX protease family)
MNFQTNQSRKRLILLSPFLVIGLGHLTAQIAGIWMGAWAWLPLTMVFWTTLTLLIVWGGGRESVRRWLSKPRGSWGWLVLALVVGFIPFIVFLQNWRLLSPLHIWLPWLLFAFINPWLEEGYWRGLLLDAAKEWKPWASVLYTSAVYAASHPLMWGVNSFANRELVVLASTFVMGVFWAIIYRRTGSLRYPVFSHILVDLFNLSVAIFLNLNIVHTSQ